MASSELVFTIAPRPRAAIRGATSRQVCQVPPRCTRSIRRHSASEMSVIGVSVRWPAQFTSTSIGPSSCSVRSTRRATASASATSSGMSVRATSMPAASSASAEAPPMPPPAPVTSATGLLNGNLLEPLGDVDPAPAVERPGHEVDDEARQEDPDVVDDAPPVAGAVRVLQAGVGVLPEDHER